MKNKDKTRFKFNCPLFGDDVYLMICDKDKANAFCKDLNLSTKHLGKTAEIEDSDSMMPAGFMVWIKEPEMYNTMVHECLHLVNKMFSYHGIPFNAENDEIIAYYQNLWVKKFWHIMANLIECKKEGTKDEIRQQKTKGEKNGKPKRIKSNNKCGSQDQGPGESRPDISKDGNK